MAVTTAAVIGGVAAIGAVASDKQHSDDAAKAQAATNVSNEQFIREQAEVARADVLPLFAGAAESRALGNQAALDVFGQSAPAQIDAFQSGNVGAQETLIAGLPQIQNALLGLPTDLSGLQPQRLNVDQSFLQQTLPQSAQPPAASIAAPQQPAQTGAFTPEQLAALLETIAPGR